MAARKRRVTKRRHSSSVKTKLGGVIKSLQDIKKHVSEPTRKRGPAKTKKDIISSLYDIEEEPITLDSPTLRRPPKSARETLRSAGMSIRPSARQTLRVDY